MKKEQEDGGFLSNEQRNAAMQAIADAIGCKAEEVWAAQKVAAQIVGAAMEGKEGFGKYSFARKPDMLNMFMDLIPGSERVRLFTVMNMFSAPMFLGALGIMPNIVHMNEEEFKKMQAKERGEKYDAPEHPEA